MYSLESVACIIDTVLCYHIWTYHHLNIKIRTHSSLNTLQDIIYFVKQKRRNWITNKSCMILSFTKIKCKSAILSTFEKQNTWKPGKEMPKRILLSFMVYYKDIAVRYQGHIFCFISLLTCFLTTPALLICHALSGLGTMFSTCSNWSLCSHHCLYTCICLGIEVSTLQLRTLPCS